MNRERSERHPLDQLGEEFVARYRRGERPSVTEFVQKYPEMADQIPELLQALMLMEELGPGPCGEGNAPSSSAAATGSVPRQLGEYRILREVSRGGMGVVYEAEQESLGRHVALKVLPFHALLDPTHLERFRREARAAARLHHTNIVPVFGVGEQHGVHYYAMQFIQGQSLDQVLQELRRMRGPKNGLTGESPGVARSGDRDTPEREQQGAACEALTGSIAQALLSGQAREAKPPSADKPAEPEGVSSVNLPGQTERSSISESRRHYLDRVARIGVQVAEALSYAHSQGIVHRDIKPSNLLLDTQGTVWVTDFGLAKAEGLEELTQTGDILGTLRYMAPERFDGRSDPRCDVYSLGLTLYELLTLHRVFEETDRRLLIKKISQEEPPRPRKLERAIPRDLETIVLKATAKEVGRRYASAAALAEDLRRFLADKPIEARRATPWEQAWRWCRRNPAVATLAVLALTCLLGGLTAALWQWRRAEGQRLQAEANFRKAREAVDECFNTVTDNPAFLEPGMQSAREVLFRATLKYYQQFQDQRSDDPAVRAELARAYARIGYITTQIGSPTEAIGAYERAGILYEQLAQPDGQARFLGELARGCQSLAALYRSTGRPDQAEAALTKSLDLCSRLVDQHPGDHGYRNDWAQGYHGLGLLYRSLGRPAQAEAAFDRAITLREPLTRAHPTVVAYQTSLAGDYRALSQVYDKASRPHEAEAILRKALACQEQVVQSHPEVADYRDGLAEILNALGSYCLMNNSAGAEEAYLRALPLREELTRQHPKVQAYQSALAKIQNNLALLYTLLNRPSEAEAMYCKALAVRERLARQYSEVALYQQALAKTHHDLGLLYNRAVKPDEADTAFHRARAIQERLVRDHAVNTDFAADLGCTLNNLSESALTRGKEQAGLEWCDQADRILEAVLRSEPRHSDARRLRRQSAAARAQLLSSLGRHAEALPHWDRALEENDNQNYRLGRAASLAGLGDYLRATALADALAAKYPQNNAIQYDAACVFAAALPAARADVQLSAGEQENRAQRYADRAIHLLTQAIAAGYLATPAHLQKLKSSKELDALRGQPGFQKWLRELMQAHKK